MSRFSSFVVQGACFPFLRHRECSRSDHGVPAWLRSRWSDGVEEEPSASFKMNASFATEQNILPIKYAKICNVAFECKQQILVMQAPMGGIKENRGAIIKSYDYQVKEGLLATGMSFNQPGGGVLSYESGSTQGLFLLKGNFFPCHCFLLEVRLIDLKY